MDVANVEGEVPSTAPSANVDDGGGSESALTTEEMLEVLSADWKRSREAAVQRPPRPVEGAPGWKIYWVRRGGHQRMGDNYFLTPRGDKIASITAARRWLEAMASAGQSGAPLVIDVHGRALPPGGRNPGRCVRHLAPVVCESARPQATSSALNAPGAPELRLSPAFRLSPARALSGAVKLQLTLTTTTYRLQRLREAREPSASEAAAHALFLERLWISARLTVEPGGRVQLQINWCATSPPSSCGYRTLGPLLTCGAVCRQIARRTEAPDNANMEQTEWRPYCIAPAEVGSRVRLVGRDAEYEVVDARTLLVDASWFHNHHRGALQHSRKQQRFAQHAEVEQQMLRLVDSVAAGEQLRDGEGWHVLAIEPFVLVSEPAMNWSTLIQQAADHATRQLQRKKGRARVKESEEPAHVEESEEPVHVKESEEPVR
eukprot:1979893-Prymnesium_polylepis.1